jgi:pimeloyl-ACP methyl ester carboxylesterase
MVSKIAGGFILVHGGEHGPWCWDKVTPQLQWPAIAVALPGRNAQAGDPIRFGLDDNAQELAHTVNRAMFDPCIVVCHSLGGLTVLAAEPVYTSPPHHRVFVSALTPRPGSTGLDALPPLFRAYLRLRLKTALRKRTVLHLLPRWLAGAIWFHDLDKSQRTRATQALCAESPAIPMQRTPSTPPNGDNSTYIEGYSKPHVIEKKNNARVASNESR